MKLSVINKNKIIELEGTIKKIKNKFFIELEVPDDIRLESIITNIKGYYNPIGNITLVNNRIILVRGSQDQTTITIYEYEASYAISSHINEDTILIKSMSIYFKELDYFFVEDEWTMDVKKMSEGLTITQKYRSEELLRNEKILIYYNKTAGIDNDEAGHTLFLTPSKLSITFSNPLKLSQIFREMTKIENCLGFVIGRKMNLIEVNICDLMGIEHELIVPYQKDYNEIILSEFHVVDLNSKQLLKDILVQYYSNNRITAAISMFYMYIYNDLDNVFEFTSLVNTLELLLTDPIYSDDIKRYTVLNNKELKVRDKKMCEILNLLSKEQCKFIKSFYRFENVELRDKLKFIFYDKFGLQQTEKSDEYISRIVKTRNYYVHGGKKNKILGGVNIVYTKILLKNILYNLIVKVCSAESNCMIDSYRLTIPGIYRTVVENIDLNK